MKTFMSNPDVSPPEDSVQDHKGLKAVVIILGVLLILGFIALIVGVFYQISKEDPAEEVSVPVNLANVDLNGDILLHLPQGAQIIQVDLDGERAAVLVQHPGSTGQREILIVDLNSGQVAAKLHAREE